MTTSSAYLTPWLAPHRNSDYPPRLMVDTAGFGARTAEDEAERIVALALDSGNHFFNVSDADGGAAQRVLAKALRGRRQQVGIALSAGNMPSQGDLDSVPGVQLLRAVDESLERLGTDFVDVLWLEATSGRGGDSYELYTAARLREAGKVRHWGVAECPSWRLHDLNAVCDRSGLPRPVMLRTGYNLVSRQFAREYQGFLNLHPLHVAASGALAGGLLAQRHEGSRQDFPRCALAFAEELGALAREGGLRTEELAYAWLTQEFRVGSVVVAPDTVEDLEVARRGVRQELSDEALDRIDALHARYFLPG
jgi:aryl-alcohol dehydrogenase-like predicted oxidoreductase